MSDSSISWSLAAFAAGLSLSDVPGDVRERAGQVLREALSAARAGAPRNAVPRGTAGVNEVCSSSLREQVIDLAFAISLGSEPTSLAEGFRPETCVAPVVAVLANEHELSTEKILLSLVIGCEMGLRMERALRTTPPSGWSVPSVVARIASATGATRALEGSAREHLSAIGIAATQAAGTKGSLCESSGAWLASRCAVDGLVAALLAKGDWLGPDQPLEGRRGLFFLLTGEGAPTSLTDGLGDEWLTRSLPSAEGPLRPIEEVVRDLFPVFNVTFGSIRDEA